MEAEYPVATKYQARCRQGKLIEPPKLRRFNLAENPPPNR
jgi:hypothetical protein